MNCYVDEKWLNEPMFYFNDNNMAKSWIMYVHQNQEEFILKELNKENIETKVLGKLNDCVTILDVFPRTKESIKKYTGVTGVIKIFPDMPDSSHLMVNKTN